MSNTGRRFLSVLAPDQKIDREAGIIRGVSLITAGEAKGHDMLIDGTTLDQLFQCAIAAGTIKFKIAHTDAPTAIAGYFDNFARLATKVTGDLHIYKSEPQADRIFEIAETNPAHFALSVEFEGPEEMKSGKAFARCSDLKAVALVDEAAANKSLFAVDNSKKGMADETNPTPEKEVTKPNALDEIMAKLDAFESRFASYEEKMAKLQPADPAAGGEGKDVTQADIDAEVDPGKKAALQKKFDDQAAPKTDDKPDEKDPATIAEMKAIRAEVKKLSAAIGVHGLKGPGGGSTDVNPAGNGKKKNFEELVKEKTTELKGDKNAAILFCIQHHKDEYAAWRPVKPKETKTL